MSFNGNVINRALADIVAGETTPQIILTPELGYRYALIRISPGGATTEDLEAVPYGKFPLPSDYRSAPAKSEVVQQESEWGRTIRILKDEDDSGDEIPILAGSSDEISIMMPLEGFREVGVLLQFAAGVDQSGVTYTVLGISEEEENSAAFEAWRAIISDTGGGGGGGTPAAVLLSLANAAAIFDTAYVPVGGADDGVADAAAVEGFTSSAFGSLGGIETIVGSAPSPDISGALATLGGDLAGVEGALNGAANELDGSAPSPVDPQSGQIALAATAAKGSLDTAAGNQNGGAPANVVAQASALDTSIGTTKTALDNASASFAGGAPADVETQAGNIEGGTTAHLAALQTDVGNLEPSLAPGSDVVAAEAQVATFATAFGDGATGLRQLIIDGEGGAWPAYPNGAGGVAPGTDTVDLLLAYLDTFN